MIVPEIAAGAAAELDDLRAACDAAVARLAASGARRLLVVGADTATREYACPFRGSFAPWGVPVEVTLGDPSGAPAPLDGGSGAPAPLDGGSAGPPASPVGPSGAQPPLSLLVGAWLIGRVLQPAHPVDYGMHGIGADAAPSWCARHATDPPPAGPWALLVMGDGSACRGRKAPGYDDPRAAAYDDGVARALATADTDALLDLDPALSARLKAAGRAPWQVLAGAARAAGGAWRGELTYHAAPYGVGYFVATWEPA
jgi:hypothetical protein